MVTPKSTLGTTYAAIIGFGPELLGAGVEVGLVTDEVVPVFVVDIVDDCVLTSGVEVVVVRVSGLEVVNVVDVVSGLEVEVVVCRLSGLELRDVVDVVSGVEVEVVVDVVLCIGLVACAALLIAAIPMLMSSEVGIAIPSP